jgi:hypothetical protein
MTEYQYAWMFYGVGALGCCLAAGLLFRRAGRAWVHFFVITVAVILATPYALDAESMIMAPAVFGLVFGFMIDGFPAVKPSIKLMLGLWLGALVLSLIYQLLTPRRADNQAPAEYDNYEEDEEEELPAYHPEKVRGLSRHEQSARAELLRGEEPMRAVR